MRMSDDKRTRWFTAEEAEMEMEQAEGCTSPSKHHSSPSNLRLKRLGACIGFKLEQAGRTLLVV